MIDRIFFEPRMKREVAFSVVVNDNYQYFHQVAFSVVVYDNYQYFHQVASRFMGGGNAVKLIVFGID